MIIGLFASYCISAPDHGILKIHNGARVHSSMLAEEIRAYHERGIYEAGSRQYCLGCL